MIQDSANPALKIHPLGFSGTTREYFPIWIVNLLLTICTLGIYSAWAKVRTLRWFYGHTQIDGHSFDYHATGWRILKGRLLALLLIALMAFLAVAHPLLQLVNLVLLVCLIPWVINASLRFQLRMSSWRNVRFDFSGAYGRAFWIYVGLPLVLGLGVLLLMFAIGLGVIANLRGMPQNVTPSPGMMIAVAVALVGLMLAVALLAMPIFVRLRAIYLVGNAKFGTAPFAVTLALNRLYRLAGRSFLAALAVFVSATVLAFGLMFLAIKFNLFNVAPPSSSGEYVWHYYYDMVLAAYVGFYAAAVAFAMHFTTHVRNEILNQLTIDGAHRMRSNLSPWRLLWILFSNAALVSATLGLMLPWARVRYHRYVCGQIALIAAGDLDQFVSANTHAPSSFGGEFSAMEGIDAGFGV